MRWYGEGRRWPSSNMDSSKTPLKSPEAATEETWWKCPASSRPASSTALRVPPTFICSFISSEAVMS